MSSPMRFRELRQTNGWRYTMLALGWLLLVLTPVVGVLPGPGGIFVAAAGVALLLRNSLWAKRQYVRIKRRWPRHGHLLDKGLRRRPAPRRRPSPD